MAARLSPGARTLRGALAALALVAAATGQAPEARKVSTFRAPDGTRFVLVPDANEHQVHWAVSSWVDGRDDPRRLKGLALATVRASLNGTWEIGGRGERDERAAWAALDEANRQLRKQKNDAARAQTQERERALRALGDLRTFRRVLAATPAHRPELIEDGPTATFVLTTVADAIPDVGRLLLARRERQALRDLPAIWRELLAARIAARKRDRSAPLHAEVLALMMPVAERAEMLEWQSPDATPTFDQAMACWQASQHPTRTVHVLFGNFDAAATRAVLGEVFAATALPAPPPHEAPELRPLRTERRSLVHGFGTPHTAIAWALPKEQEPWALEVLTRWLADEKDGWLVKRIRRKGFLDVEVRCSAPWPRVESGRSLMLIELLDRSGKPGLLDEVLAQCASLSQQKLDDGAFYGANMQLQHEWNTRHGDPRATAAAVARDALLFPRRAPHPAAPPRVTAAPVTAVIAATFGSKPAIVEGRR